MRKGKRSGTTAQAWLFALAIPGALLFMLFSLLPYDRMVRDWPFGIMQDEVMAFQEIFDHRPGQHVEGHAEVFSLSTRPDGTVLLAAAGEEAGARLQRHGQGFTLQFDEEAPFRKAFMLEFMPADLNSLGALYAGAVADSLPIRSPWLALVKVVRDGGKEEPYLVQQRMTPAQVMASTKVAMAWVDADGKAWGEETARPAGDTIGAAAKRRLLDPQRFDTASTPALGLLICAGQRPDLRDGAAGALCDGITGDVQPLYAARSVVHTRASTSVQDGFRAALAEKGNQQRVLQMAARLRLDSAAWAARFLAIDSAAVPVLAKSRNIGLVQAGVDRARTDFLHHLFHPDVMVCLGQPTDLPSPSGLPLDPWLKQFRTQGDTIRFIRGKYDIDKDLVLPEGMAVVLEKGARWFMAPGVSVVINGELHMRGTDLNPVFIRPQDEARPWGSIAVNGNGRTRVRIRGLRISGGSDLLWQGVHHGGMLSFIRADAILDNCSIGESFGAAAVSAQRGGFKMTGCYLEGPHGSFLELAETQGVIERCNFVQPGGAPEAGVRNAVNMRASDLLLRGCSFSDLPFTAVRVARGGKAALQGSRFNGNKVAIAALDGSTVRVTGCDFANNGKVFVLRRDRPVLGGATLVEEGNTFNGNAVLKEVDAASKFEQGNGAEAGQWGISPSARFAGA